MSEATLDFERQKEAKSYARIRHRLMVVDIAIGGVYCLTWLVFGWSHELKSWLLTFTTNEWLLLAGFGIIFGGIFILINLPLSYYEGFILPHRFNMSNQTNRGWIADQFKGLLIGALIGGLVLEVIYAVLRAAPQTWWLWAGLILLLFNVVLASLAPVLLFPIFNKFVPLGDEYEELKTRLVNLAERAGTHVRGVFKFDMSRRTKAANAALTGMGNTRRIILGDTLLEEFNTDEIETVLAHELGHHVHKDIPKGIFVESIITMGGLYFASLVLNWGTNYFSLDGPADIAALPLFVLVIGIYGLFTMPLSNMYSRWRERRADEYALITTGNGSAYASAMTRLANQNLADADPEPWVEFLLHSHPALQERIKTAQEFNIQA
jgi:STE24 endopeptidase